MRKPFGIACLVLLSGLLAGFGHAEEAGPSSAAAAAKKVDFARDIEPILAERCWSCHGKEAAEGGLRLHVKKLALAGGDSGKAIIPGKSAGSRLVKYVTGENDSGLRMPPETSGEPLAAGQVAVLKLWIDQGATWPDDPGKAAADQRSKHWSFQPIRRPRLPAVKNAAWVQNAIDHFVLAELERRGVQPSPEADRATLVRRLSLDLLGLPPTPSEVNAFVYDSRPDAYDRLVDRLLASPHYGERWGRHWLDLARYADSDGYEKDLPRPHAWRYRQWVIEALNRDLPFDQFTIQQLAGDLLEGEVDPPARGTGILPVRIQQHRLEADATSAIERRIATGFHRNTLTNREGGIDPEEDRVKQTIDRTNTTGTVWLGLTVECAQCHTHKYDPISQREYYGLYAFFNSLQEVDLPLRPAQETDNVGSAVRTKEPIVEPTTTAVATAPAAVGATTVAKAKESTAKEKAKAAKAKSASTEAMAQTLAEAARQRETRVLIRGDFLRPGDTVEPETPAVLPPLETNSRRPTRLDLARWLVDERNPLTPRVTVNRIWQSYFGQGLVDTPHDFGTQGSTPTHPALLDWLASEFSGSKLKVQGSKFKIQATLNLEPQTSNSGSGWSLKSLHRLIVTSATYRQSSRARPDLRESDPYNKLLARQNRLRVEAEVVRDLALAASGLLEPRIGGPSVRPPQPAGIDALGYAGAVKWPVSTGADRYRRGAYTFFQRTVPYPMFKDFDAPDGNLACTKRERSNTPISALTLQNDPVFVECCQALARRIVLEEPGHGNENCDRAGRVNQAFLITLGRRPSQRERGVLVKLHRDTKEHFSSHPAEARQLVGTLPKPPEEADDELAAWTVVARTLLNLDEFITRE